MPEKENKEQIFKKVFEACSAIWKANVAVFGDFASRFPSGNEQTTPNDILC